MSDDRAISTSESGEARKVVTVLFSDVTGSTHIGEQLDPESLRRLMARYFDEMRTILERHGGTVEKFIGDAVMAVFGIPMTHEDDALRAVRAAVEMQDALASLNEDFLRSWDVALATRTGVNTGEVVAGEPGQGKSLVIGDAVNVAARLEQTAEPGQILVGDTTRQLVRDAIAAEEVGLIPVRGRGEPVRAWRLIEVLPVAAGWSRRLDAALIGREREMASLQDAFGRTVGSGQSGMVTILGAAGIGKSRLVAEFVGGLEGDATVIEGRCLPYGEGISFWPVVEAVRAAAGIGEDDSPLEARAKVTPLLPSGDDGAVVGQRLEALLGLAEALPGIQQTFWAVRRLFEELADRRPLVVVFDDIQWGESTFLDFLEYLADWMHEVPALVVCLARPELLEARPGWMEGKPSASVIRLDSLSDATTDDLITNLLRRADLAEDARSHITRVAEGNPLFVEETLRMLVDDGLLQPADGTWTVSGDLSRVSIPPTIQAVLAARLDRLEDEELNVIQCGSVVGRVFWWGAVSELVPPEQVPYVGRSLQSLTRKELVRPDQSELVGEDAFRFTHILIRDAAYERIPKARRAELHERLAGWVEANTRERAGEYEEILGFHLEQAYVAHQDLGDVSEDVEGLARRAGNKLASAGMRALAREDLPAGIGLLSRAISLLPKRSPQRLGILPPLAFALMETGDFERLQAVVGETKDDATAVGDPGLLAHAWILELWIRLFTTPEGWVEETQRVATEAIATFGERGDDGGLAKAWSILGLMHVLTAQFAEAGRAWARAAGHARRAGQRRDELDALSWVLLSAWAGPEHAEEGLRRCREVLERAQGDRKGMATAMFMQAVLEAGLGRFDEARELVGRSQALLRELALTVWMAGPQAHMAGIVELSAGDPEGAERELRWGYDVLRQIGEMSYLSTSAGLLAEALYEQGRYDEASEATVVGEESARGEDVYSQVLWRSVRAKVMAQRGSLMQAEDLAREAVTIVEPTDSVLLRAEARANLAEVLEMAGKPAEAGPILKEAVDLFEQKGNLVGASRARQRLDALPV